MDFASEGVDFGECEFQYNRYDLHRDFSMMLSATLGSISLSLPLAPLTPLLCPFVPLTWLGLFSAEGHMVTRGVLWLNDLEIKG